MAALARMSLLLNPSRANFPIPTGLARHFCRVRHSWLPPPIPAYERVFTPIRPLPFPQRVRRMLSLKRNLLKLKITHHLRMKFAQGEPKGFFFFLGETRVMQVQNASALGALAFVIYKGEQMFEELERETKTVETSATDDVGSSC